jgi:NAD(P)-dependent dehydrogenase (short-subunit alcohol dehydrogenase family)
LNNKKLKNIAFVTGASRGIGSAIAFRLAIDGFMVVVGYHKNKNAAYKVVEKINKSGGSSTALQIDVASHLSIKLAFKKILKLGQIEVLVNNAAISQEKPFLKITEKDFDRMTNTNLRGVFFCIQEALPSMIDKRFGRIVNIASIGGQWGGINQIHYATTKAGILGLTRSIAKTFSSKGITCNAVSPGLVGTEMSDSELKTKQGQLKIKQIPLGRIGLSDEIAGTVSFLVGPDGAYLTGQTINPNGGMYFG